MNKDDGGSTHVSAAMGDDEDAEDPQARQGEQTQQPDLVLPVLRAFEAELRRKSYIKALI